MSNQSKIEVLEINIKHRYYPIIIITAFVSFIGLSILVLLINNEILKSIFGILILPLVYLISNNVARQIMEKINYKNLGYPIIDESGILQTGKKKINLKKAEKIIFRYCGDGFWQSKNLISSKIKKRQRYNRWVLTDKKFIFDNLQIDKELIYFKILSKSDKSNFMEFANSVKEINGMTKLIIQGREKDLPITD